MPEAPVGKRQFHTFISHAHVDKKRADEIVAWLKNIANIPVWYDANAVAPGSMIASTLYQGIEESRSLILLVSEQSIEKGWVEQEYSAAIDHQTWNRRFRIVPVLLDDSSPPGFVKNYSNIKLDESGLSLEAASAILRGLYTPSGVFHVGNGRDVYISRGWHPSDQEFAAKACAVLVDTGFQLIGDAEDQTSWIEQRIDGIIRGCGAFVGILPGRPQAPHGTSKYVLREWELARAAGLPCLVLRGSQVTLPDELEERPEVVDIADLESDDESRLRSAVLEFADDYSTPEKAPYIFYATDFTPNDSVTRNAVKELIESITAMPCILGEYVQGEVVQRDILRMVANAATVIADISGDSPNVYIELGAARTAEVSTAILREGPPGRPAFMLRDQQVWDYATSAELLGRVARIVYPLRRSLLSERI